MTTLSQWLGSFSAESRPRFVSKKRQSVPLSPPINRGGFNTLKEGRLEAKVKKKPSFCLVFLSPPSRQPLWPLPSQHLSYGCRYQPRFGLPYNTRNDSNNCLPPTKQGYATSFSCFPLPRSGHCMIFHAMTK